MKKLNYKTVLLLRRLEEDNERNVINLHYHYSMAYSCYNLLGNIVLGFSCSWCDIFSNWYYSWNYDLVGSIMRKWSEEKTESFKLIGGLEKMIKLEDIKAGDEVQIANGDWFEVVADRDWETTKS